jgi:hypothetical protein
MVCLEASWRLPLKHVLSAASGDPARVIWFVSGTDTSAEQEICGIAQDISGSIWSGLSFNWQTCFSSEGTLFIFSGPIVR